MKNLKNIIASIILVAISFVSYTQTGIDTLKYKFYLEDENVDTIFNVSNTTQNDEYILSKDILNLDTLNYNMNFSMDSTIYKNNNVLTNSASVTKIYLISDSINNTTIIDENMNFPNYINNSVKIDSIEHLITKLIDDFKNGVEYTHVVFEIKPVGNKIYTGFAINYTVAVDTSGTSSIDTEVIEVSNTRVYPNPVMNSLNIEFETINTDTEVEIYSTNGQLMYKDVEYRNFGINKVSVDMSNYQPGMYIVKLGNVVKKVIKQ